MKILKLFTTLRLNEDLNNDDPSNKSLKLSLMLNDENNVNFSSSVVYEQQCHINKTSDYSGIVEATNEQKSSFKIASEGVSMLFKQGKEFIQFVGKDLEKIFTPENFLFYDEKYFKFLISQNKTDSTFFDTSVPYVTLDKDFIVDFFKNVQKVIRKDLFKNLNDDDTIELCNL